MVKDSEIWREVPGKPEFLASSWGRILRQPHFGAMPHGGYRLYLPEPTYGYDATSKRGAKHVYKNCMYRGVGTQKVHQLVCAAFHGPKPFEGAVVIHLDEDGCNNRPDNLKWGTQKENLNAPGFLDYCRTRPRPWGPLHSRQQKDV